MIKQAYLIRRESDGTMRTVQAQSCRGAMLIFVGTYKPPYDEVFRVKPRDSGSWEYYKVTPQGVRKLKS